MKKLKMLSLFDGSGGFPLAGQPCGIEVVAASEIEPFPIRVSHARFPNMKHLGSVTEINGGEIEPVDVVCFSSPCQDISIAGNRDGLRDGKQSSLFFEAIRIIKEMRKATNGEYPRFCVWENVEGARSSNKGDDFRCIIESICRIADESVTIHRTNKWYDAGFVRGGGYSLAWRLYDTQYWPRTPQRRKRFYIVGDFAGESAYKILFKRKGSEGNNPQESDKRKGSSDDSEESAGGDYQFSVDCRNATIDKNKTHTLQSHQTGGINVNCIPSVMYDAKKRNEIDSVSPPPVDTANNEDSLR